MASGEPIWPYPPPSDRRTRFRFSLRAIFVLTTVVAAVSAVVARWGAIAIAFIFLILAGIALLQVGRGIVKLRPGTAASGVFALILLFAISVPIFTVAVWDGYKTIPLRFTVVDSESGDPIRGATVRIRRTEWEPAPLAIRSGERGVQGTTGPDGTVVLSDEFNTSGHEGWLENYGFVYFNPECLVQITANGHAPYQMRLNKLVGRKRDIRDPVAPPISISLEREVRADK
jgi:hypothetical protein